MQEKYINQNIQIDPDTAEIGGESGYEHFYYGKSRDSEEFLLSHDLDTGGFYLPVQSGFGMGLELLKEDNLGTIGRCNLIYQNVFGFLRKQIGQKIDISAQNLIG